MLGQSANLAAFVGGAHFACAPKRLRHGRSSVCSWFHRAAGQKWSSCSCNRPVHCQWCWCARYCTSSHLGRHGCCVLQSKYRSRRTSTDATSTDRRQCWMSPSERSSSMSTMTRRDGALQRQRWCKWNNEGSVNGCE